jgi:hypothetical protein
MTKKELKELLKGNSPKEKHNLSSSDFLNIGRFANVSLLMDKSTFDYYYEIDINELLGSKIPEEEYEVIKDQGWSIKGEKIILYLI